MQKIPLILTRPDGANEAFAAEFPKALAHRLDFIACPLMRIVAADADATLDPGAAAIFTSVNGVRFGPNPIGQTAYCIGVRTTRAAQAAGWDAVRMGQTAEDLIAGLLQVRPAAPLCHLSGVHVRGDIVETLIASGLRARRVAVYDQLLLPLTNAAKAAFLRSDPVIVPLFSPRASAHFATLGPFSSPLCLVTMSAAVTAALGHIARFKVHTAPEPTVDAVIEGVEKQVETLSLG